MRGAPERFSDEKRDTILAGESGELFQTSGCKMLQNVGKLIPPTHGQ